MPAKVCAECAFYKAGRCLRYPAWMGPHGIPDRARGPVWAESDHPQVDPLQPGCGDFKEGGA